MMQIHHVGDHRPLRAAEYPAIGDQLDVLWRWAAALPSALRTPELEAMLGQVEAVKTKYEKGGEDAGG